MVTNPRLKLILDMFANRISEDEFLREIGIKRGSGSGFALSMLEDAYRENNKVDVEVGLHLGFGSASLPIFWMSLFGCRTRTGLRQTRGSDRWQSQANLWSERMLANNSIGEVVESAGRKRPREDPL